MPIVSAHFRSLITLTVSDCDITIITQALPVRPPDALGRRTTLSGGQANSIHTTTPDRQDCRACLSTAAVATLARQAATPSRPTSHTQRRCTPSLWNVAYDLNLNFFNKRHATRLICRLTVQSLPGGRETQFHRLARHRHVRRAV